MTPGEVTVSFEYRRHVGPRYVHGSVTLQFAFSTGFQFKTQAIWPRGEDYTSAVERAVREVLANQGVLDCTSCTLVCIDWDEVASCAAGFEAAARAATRGAFEAG